MATHLLLTHGTDATKPNSSHYRGDGTTKFKATLHEEMYYYIYHTAFTSLLHSLVKLNKMTETNV